MSALNRRMFSNRDARVKLANMGGIISSSPELLGAAQMYAEGGNASAPEVEQYVAVIPGVNESRPVRLRADTLARLQEIAPGVMAKSFVMDSAMAAENNLNVMNLRPADAFVERSILQNISEQIPEAPVPETTSRPSYDNINVAGPPSLGFPSPLEQAARTEQYNNAAPVEAVAPRVREGGIAGVMRDVADVYAGNPSRTALDSQSTGYRAPNIGATELNTPAIRNALAELSDPDQGPRQLSDAEIVANARALLSPEANDRIDREATDEIIANALGPNSELTSQNGPPSVFQLGSQFNGTPVNINALVDPSNLSYGKRLLETLIPASENPENPVSTESGLERFERQNIEENPDSAVAKRAEIAELNKQGYDVRQIAKMLVLPLAKVMDVVGGAALSVPPVIGEAAAKIAAPVSAAVGLPTSVTTNIRDTADFLQDLRQGYGEVPRLSNLFPEEDPGPSIQDQIKNASLAAIVKGSGSDDPSYLTLESQRELVEEIPELVPSEPFDISGKSAEESGMAKGEVGSFALDSYLNRITDAILDPKKKDAKPSTEERKMKEALFVAPEKEPTRKEKIATANEVTNNTLGPDGLARQVTSVTEEMKLNPTVNPNTITSKAVLDSAGVDTKNMTTKERILAQKKLLSDLLGRTDADKKEEFWMNMAMMGFAIAAGESPNAIQNISNGLLTGVASIQKGKASDRKRDDDLTLTAFQNILAEDAATTKFDREVDLAEIRAGAKSGFPTVDRLWSTVYKSNMDLYKDQMDTLQMSPQQAHTQAAKIASQASPDSQFAQSSVPDPHEAANAAALAAGEKTYTVPGDPNPYKTQEV